MEQVRDLSDDRLVNGCLYCGGLDESRDHVPSRVFLDSPFPRQLPVVGSCVTCNNDFSQDEAYVACLIESVLVGSTSPDDIRRERIADLMCRTPKLRARLESAKTFVGGNVQFEVESERVRNVVLKLARGHAAFELSQVCRDEPISFRCLPLAVMTEVEINDFDASDVVGYSSDVVGYFGEIGSRGMQRMLVAQFSFASPEGTASKHDVVINDWVDVQENRYRYLAIDNGDEITIKIVIAEYLACEVVWAR